VRDGNEEGGNDKLGADHDDATGWLMSSKEIRPRVYICSLISCECEKP
jgi:hypothetical protein